MHNAYNSTVRQPRVLARTAYTFQTQTGHTAATDQCDMLK